MYTAAVVLRLAAHGGLAFHGLDHCPRLSACGARGGTGDGPDVGEHAAGVPGWKGSDQRREAVDLDAALPRRLRPRELAGVPFDEGFGVRGDKEVLVVARARLADLGVAKLDE